MQCISPTPHNRNLLPKNCILVNVFFTVLGVESLSTIPEVWRRHNSWDENNFNGRLQVKKLLKREKEGASKLFLIYLEKRNVMC